MINTASLNTVDAASFDKGFCRPLYDSYCFSRIPGTILKLFKANGLPSLPADTITTGKHNIVVLFLIDAFGWRFFEKYKEKYPFLKRFVQEGIVSKITSQFPSTTTAHVSCLNTGLEVGQSGVYEWFYYEPHVDRVIAPFLFSFAGDKEGNTLLKAGISPQELFPKELLPHGTIYDRLKKNKISSWAFQHANIVESPCSEVMFTGAHNVPYLDIQLGLTQLVETINASSEGFFYFYFGDIDATAHRHGVNSKEVEDVIHGCLTNLEELFWKKLNKKATVIMTADHGMTDIDPKTTIYINKEIPGIEKYIKKNRAGKLIVPAGSCRDFFLHLEESTIDEAEALLRKHLSKSMAIYRTEELIRRGFFGQNPPSAAFLSRVGNLVLLPYGNNSIWWYEKGRFEQRFHAMHGGLTREEMESIFLFLN